MILTPKVKFTVSKGQYNELGQINDTHLKINEHTAWHVLASTSLGKESVESIVATADGLVGGHLAVGLDAVLQAVELPAGITNLNTGLADVDRNYLTHCKQ